MSYFCVHEHSYSGNYYEPPEFSCDYEDEGYDCDECPYRYSKEDLEADRADMLYDMYKDFVDF